MRKQKKMMLMVMAALALTACGSSEEPKQEMVQSESTQKQSTEEEKKSSAEESKTGEKVKLVLMHYAAEETKRSGIDAWVQSVTEQYPDIESKCRQSHHGHSLHLRCKRKLQQATHRIFLWGNLLSLFNWQRPDRFLT